MVEGFEHILYTQTRQQAVQSEAEHECAGHHLPGDTGRRRLLQSCTGLSEMYDALPSVRGTTSSG